MAGEFWLGDRQWAVIAPLLPTNQPGAHRTDDRRGISGIIHVLRSGCRWQDCPACYGPPTTVYNRFHRWSAKGIWRRLFEALVQMTDRDIHMIDRFGDVNTELAGFSMPDAKPAGRSAMSSPPKSLRVFLYLAEALSHASAAFGPTSLDFLKGRPA